MLHPERFAAFERRFAEHRDRGRHLFDVTSRQRAADTRREREAPFFAAAHDELKKRMDAWGLDLSKLDQKRIRDIHQAADTSRDEHLHDLAEQALARVDAETKKGKKK